MAMYCKLFCAVVLAMCVGGCVFTSPRAVYVGPGQNVEIARPVRIAGWVTNKKTGARELRVVEAQAGWFVGRIEK